MTDSETTDVTLEAIALLPDIIVYLGLFHNEHFESLDILNNLMIEHQALLNQLKTFKAGDVETIEFKNVIRQLDINGKRINDEIVWIRGELIVIKETVVKATILVVNLRRMKGENTRGKDFPQMLYKFDHKHLKNEEIVYENEVDSVDFGPIAKLASSFGGVISCIRIFTIECLKKTLNDFTMYTWNIENEPALIPVPEYLKFKIYQGAFLALGCSKHTNIKDYNLLGHIMVEETMKVAFKDEREYQANRQMQV